MSKSPEAVLRRLEWTVMRRLDGLLQGDYRTLFRGFGLDFADLREYQYGDDVRHIDWNVTARLQTPYVREYHEDREVTAWFLLDLSPSIDFGSGEVRKRNVSADFVAVLARILTRHGNKVGALFYGEDVDTMIPARSAPSRCRREALRHRLQTRARPSRRRSAAAPADFTDPEAVESSDARPWRPRIVLYLHFGASYISARSTWNDRCAQKPNGPSVRSSRRLPC